MSIGYPTDAPGLYPIKPIGCSFEGMNLVVLTYTSAVECKVSLI